MVPDRKMIGIFFETMVQFEKTTAIFPVNLNVDQNPAWVVAVSWDEKSFTFTTVLAYC